MIRFKKGQVCKRKNFTKSEQKIIRLIVKNNYSAQNNYMFWIVYHNGIAINYEGGIELSLDHHFRNDFTLDPIHWNSIITANFDVK